jgi:hypothetical protein
MSTEPLDHSAKKIESGSSEVSWNLATPEPGVGVLSLSGNLKPGWLGKLSSYLSHRTINIKWGTARKCSTLSWVTSFEIEDKNNRAEPFGGFNPLPALTGTDVKIDHVAPVITQFKVERSPLNGGCLYAEISGEDCIGFLYGMLKIFSFYTLFPTELEISTKGTAVFDRFWLKGIAASVPSDDDMNSLIERLKKASLES